ncbi:MAG: hypothetical protein ACK559_32840, partial [bacterium]
MAWIASWASTSSICTGSESVGLMKISFTLSLDILRAQHSPIRLRAEPPPGKPTLTLVSNGTLTLAFSSNHGRSAFSP